MEQRTLVDPPRAAEPGRSATSARYGWRPMRAPYVLAGWSRLLAAGAVSAPAAHAAIPFAPCTPAGFQCGQLAVPLDPAGAAGGTLTLNVKRRVAASNPSNTAVVGARRRPGPGGDPVRVEARPEHGARRSPPATCSSSTSAARARRAQLRCLRRSSTPRRSAPRAIGPSRAFYRTADSVDDIEAIRQSPRATASSCSTASRTAPRSPRPTPPSTRPTSRRSSSTRSCRPRGPTSSTARPSAASARRCASSAARRRCRGISGDPRGDLAALVRRLERSPLRGPVVTADGPPGAPLDERDRPPRHPARAATSTRRCAPSSPPPCAARCTATRGRSCASRSGRTSTTPSAGATTSPTALFVDTAARRAPSRGTAATAPQARADAAIARGPRDPAHADFGPFDARIALLSDAIPLCVVVARTRRPPPAPPAPLPDVPTLVIDGDADLRTPVTRRPRGRRADPGRPAPRRSRSSGTPSSARTRPAARAPASPRSSPARPVRRAPRRRRSSRRRRIAPTRLAQVPGAGTRAQDRERRRRDAPGRRRRSSSAIAADRRKPPRVGTQIGGLRSGTARWTATGIRLRRVQYVPGVLVSGLRPAVATGDDDRDRVRRRRAARHGAHPPRRRRSSAASAAAG